jgi:alcohol dehydrogenase class IV
MNFEFATATRILFGRGSLTRQAENFKEFGSRALLVTGFSSWQNTSLPEVLAGAGIFYREYAIEREPTITTIQDALDLARVEKINFVIGFGGGSAIDTAKAVAGLFTNPGEIMDYLEVVGKGLPLKEKSLPIVAIPTTAGTGSEVTRNSVIGIPEHRVKVSLRSIHLLPRLAVIDPECTLSMSPMVTITSGLDALTQVIEPFVSSHSNPLVDALCQEGIARAGRSLMRVFRDPENLAAREDMGLTSLFGGMALANAKLGAVHGIAGPFGGMFDSPHGAVCGRLLPFVAEANLLAMRSRETLNPALDKYARVARLLTSRPDATVDDGLEWLFNLIEAAQIPGLASYGFRLNELPELVEKSQAASSMKGNPIALKDSELADLLVRAS